MDAGLEELNQVVYKAESRGMKANLRCGLDDWFKMIQYYYPYRLAGTASG